MPALPVAKRLERRAAEGVAASMRLWIPTQTVLVATVSTLALLLYVFGVPAVLRGVIWVAVGAVLGWLGSLILGTETQQGIWLDISAGASGALAGFLLLGAPLGGQPLEDFLAAALGSVVAIAAAGGARDWQPMRWPPRNMRAEQ
jgi:uncharacterized membrane protein YeaQ/YmgE (transglycosylase-associated protein family)